MPNAAEDHAGAWKPLSTRELRGCATRVEWNWHALAGFYGERSADSRDQRELEFAVQYARTRLSALRSLRSTPVRRELEGLEGLHENELG